jgi:hypothetical protein
MKMIRIVEVMWAVIAAVSAYEVYAQWTPTGSAPTCFWPLWPWLFSCSFSGDVTACAMNSEGGKNRKTNDLPDRHSAYIDFFRLVFRS